MAAAWLEKAITELSGQEGFPHHLGITIAGKPDEVSIEEDVQSRANLISIKICENRGFK